jgi:hypothetical protein
MNIGDIHRRVRESDYKPWQIYLLTVSLLVCTGLYFDFSLITVGLQSLEETASELEWFVILAMQGIVIGFAAEVIYEQGNGYAKAGSNLFGSKDKILVARVGIMTGISGIVTVVVPSAVRSFTEYLVIQTFGGVILLGILLVHVGSSDWNPSTEWPALLAGSLLAVAPTLL